MPKAADVIELSKQMRSKKFNWENQAQTAAKYCMPHKARITIHQAEGERVSSDVYDSTAIDAAQIAAAGLQGFMTSPSSKWFALRFKDRRLNEDDDAKAWLHECEETIYDILNGSNFNNEIAEFYHDLVVLPGATLYEEEDPQEVVRFYNIPFEQVDLDENARGVVDLLTRTYTYNVRQAYERWGDSCGPEIREKYEKKKFTDTVEIKHQVGVRYDRKAGKNDNRNMQFYSCYVLVEKKRMLEEGGYEEFPFFVGRWRKNSGEVWGYSPAMVALPDILMLNSMSKTIIRAAQKVVDPPWLFPDENFLMPLNFNPAGINWRTGDPTEQGPFPLMTNGNIPVGLELENQRREAIRRYFFADLFLMLLDAKNMTAFEVAKRVEEKMLVLGPVIGRLMSQVLSPIIFRTFKIALRNGLLPAMPASLGDEVNLEPEYISPLARAQKLTLAQNLEGYLFTVGQMASIAPQVLDKIDWDKSVDKLANIHSIDPTLLKSDQEVQKIREVRAQEQAQANALMMAQMGGEALEKVGKGAKALTQDEGKKRAA